MNLEAVLSPSPHRALCVSVYLCTVLSAKSVFLWCRCAASIQAEANKKRSDKAKGNDNAAKDREEKTVVVPKELPLNKDRNKGRTHPSGGEQEAE